jgi:hypothetical protein
VASFYYQRDLLPGEHIIWEGRPATGLIFRPMDAFMVPFSLLWGGFAIFWNVMVWVTEAPWAMRLFGLPFVVVGLYMIAGRFVIDSRSRARTRYLVTDQRVVILKTGGSSTKSLDIKRLPALELQERRDGSGTIRFGDAASPFGAYGWGIWGGNFDTTPQFARIEDVRSVYALIRKQAA